MEETNELSDIVLNKNNTSGSNKKIILAVATLGVVLIIVIMLMNSMNSGSTDNLPQVVLPPKPQKEVAQQETTQDEPLFEEVEVMQDDTSDDADLDKIAQKLKKESQQVEKIEKNVEAIEEVATTPKAPAVQKKRVHKVATKKATTSIKYYIQVGSFSKYEPNKKFLNSIKRLGYGYKYHKVGSLNKVLVGPFTTREEANRAKKRLRAKVEPGAFLVKL